MMRTASCHLPLFSIFATRCTHPLHDRYALHNRPAVIHEGCEGLLPCFYYMPAGHYTYDSAGIFHDRIANDLQILINKSLMNGSGDGIKIYFGFQLGKNAVKSF
jgi:hypothetical protein